MALKLSIQDELLRHPFWRFCQEQKREQELQRVQKARFGANQAETVGHEVAKDIQHDAFSERERESLQSSPKG